MIISKSRKGSVDNFRESGIEVFVFCFRKRKTMTVGDKSFWKMSKGVKRKEKKTRRPGPMFITDWLFAWLRRRHLRCRPPNRLGVVCTRTRRRPGRPTTARASAAGLWPSACTPASCTIWNRLNSGQARVMIAFRRDLWHVPSFCFSCYSNPVT